MEDQMRRLQEDIIVEKYASNFSDMNSWLQEEMKFKMELCEQQMEEVRGRREVEITQLDGKLQASLLFAGADAFADADAEITQLDGKLQMNLKTQILMVINALTL